MSYTYEIHQVARDLARLLGRNPREHTSTLPAAYVARDAVLDLIADVHRDLLATGAGRLDQTDHQLVVELGAHLEQTARVADGRARPPGIPRPTEGSAAALWESVDTHARRARREWRTADPTTRPTGPFARAALADLAALTEMISDLSFPLAEASAAAGHREQAALLAEPAQPGLLGATAERLRNRLEAGPTLPPVHDPAPAQIEPMLVRTPADLLQAQRRLAVGIQTTELAPGDLARIALQQARTAAAIANVLDEHAPTQAAGLRGLATQLLKAGAHPGQVISAGRGDSRPVEQAGHVAAYATGWKPVRRNMRMQTELAAYYEQWARALPKTVRALSAAAQQAWITGRWHVPDPTVHASQGWTPYRPGLRTPRLLTELQEAAAMAEPRRPASALALQYLPGPAEVRRSGSRLRMKPARPTGRGYRPPGQSL